MKLTDADINSGYVIKVENFKADTIFEYIVSRPKITLVIKVEILLETKFSEPKREGSKYQLTISARSLTNAPFSRKLIF